MLHSGLNFKDGYCRISHSNVPRQESYLIKLAPDSAKKYDGKKVVVSGSYKIIRGNKYKAVKENKNNSQISYEDDVYLFNSPIIRLQDTMATLTFTGTFDATKRPDGYYDVINENEYYGNLALLVVPKELAKQLDGKKVKVTGVYIIIKGAKNLPPRWGTDGFREYYSGMDEDVNLIRSPTIELSE